MMCVSVVTACAASYRQPYVQGAPTPEAFAAAQKALGLPCCCCLVPVPVPSCAKTSALFRHTSATITTLSQSSIRQSSSSPHHPITTTTTTTTTSINHDLSTTQLCRCPLPSTHPHPQPFIPISTLQHLCVLSLA